MLILILLCFSLKVAEVSLSESGHLVPRWLTPHTGNVPTQSLTLVLLMSFTAHPGVQ
jgi:hypothetical protein